MPKSIQDKAAKKIMEAKTPDINFLYGTAKPGPYTTPLSLIDELKFQQWVKDNNVPWQDTPKADYDMRGFYKAAMQGKASTAINPFDNKIHYPDTFKTPYHKSFSMESQYATPNAPSWVGNDDSGYALQDKLGNVLVDERAPNAALINKMLNLFVQQGQQTPSQ
jgi:hypothetical protein